MNLLPKSHTEFSKTEYWDSFFKKRGAKAFEWYGEYLELSEHLHKYMKKNDDILVVGCGNSKLSADLYDVGFTKQINVDISQVVIKQMIQLNKTKRPDMIFKQMDVLQMDFDDSNFNAILDKGTLDALMVDDSDEVKEKITKYFNEMNRVLKPNGRYICISLLQSHILHEILHYFGNGNWVVRIIRCHDVEKKQKEEFNNLSDDKRDSKVMPVFAVILTKFKQLSQSILELCMCNDKIVRVKDCNSVIDAVTSAQNVEILKNVLSTKSLSETNEVCMELMKPDEDSPRFTLHVLDQPVNKKNGIFAAFIVPQGRELDWIFSTPEGRKELHKSAGYIRLAIVNMHRGQIYDNLDSIKEELSNNVTELAPKTMKGQIPFLSLGDDVGKREVLYQGFSDVSGSFVIEEICGNDGATYRRLVFLSNQNIVQSESKIVSARGENGKMVSKIDYGYLACSHHIYMTLGIQLAHQNKNENNVCDIAIIGLGGGGLCSFLQRCFDNLNMTAIDNDPEMFEIAKKYFGLTCNEMFSVIITDGIKFIENSKIDNKKYDALLFDVDSKDVSIGMSCPPVQFVDEKVLRNVSQCLNDKGYFILNLVCRDENLKLDTIKKLESTFFNVVSYKLEQDVNEVFFCTNNDIKDWHKEFKIASEKVNSKTVKNKLHYEDVIDKKFMKSLNITYNKNKKS